MVWLALALEKSYNCTKDHGALLGDAVKLTTN